MASPPRGVGGTRGGALDATLEHKTQAVIIFWKRMATKQLGKMEAYQFAATKTRQSVQTVKAFVAAENNEGVGGLAS